MRTSFLEGGAELAALREEWERLPTREPDNPLFTSPAWFSAWRDCFGDTTRNGVLAFRSESELIGVMPFMLGRLWRGPALGIRFDYRPGDEAFLRDRPRYRFLRVRQASPAMGIECGNVRGGLRSQPGREGACLRALFAFLCAFGGWTLAVFPVAESRLDEWREALAPTPLRGQLRSLRRRIHGRAGIPDWKDFLASRTRHFRKRVIHAVNHAARAGLEMRDHVGVAQAEAGLEALFQLAGSSWKATGREGESLVVPMTPATRRFYATLCSGGETGIEPVVSVLYEGDVPRAAMLNLVCQRTLVPCLTYFDPAVAAIYPGRLLMKAMFEWAHRAGLERIDFNATHDWVEPFADRTELYRDLVVFNDTRTGRGLHRLVRRFVE